MVPCHIAMAMKKGYLDALGLNVKPVLFSDAANEINDFIAGRFDIRFLDEGYIPNALCYGGRVFFVSALNRESNMIPVWPDSNSARCSAVSL
jgi:ABC-type nitrate/sulfonate/bicarbonate transport system substrate-binding protein